MRKKIVISSLFLVLCAGYVINATDTIEAMLANHTIYYNGIEINSKMDFPILSYNDNNYMAVRDVAKMFAKKIIWNEENQSIYISKNPENNKIIHTKETALEIGKAIIKENYVDRITQKTEFTCVDITGSTLDDHYEVAVIFDYDPQNYDVPEEEIFLSIYNNADVMVSINPVDGTMKIIEKDENGKWKDNLGWW